MGLQWERQSATGDSVERYVRSFIALRQSHRILHNEAKVFDYVPRHWRLCSNAERNTSGGDTAGFDQWERGQVLIVSLKKTLAYQQLNFRKKVTQVSLTPVISGAPQAGCSLHYGRGH